MEDINNSLGKYSKIQANGQKILRGNKSHKEIQVNTVKLVKKLNKTVQDQKNEYRNKKDTTNGSSPGDRK